MKDSSHKRHIAKAITWRFIGTLDTMLLSWFITGDAFIGLQIGVAEVFTKMILYYFHERLWFRINLNSETTNWRHVAKTVSWRIIGTIDTMILAWLISGDPLVGLKVGLVEVITKMLLYYLHEKVWYRSNYGLDHRNSRSRSIANE